MGETSSAYRRRRRFFFFDKYIIGKGIDIGCGDDKIHPDADAYDIDDGDATYMSGVIDGSYDYVYSSHCLEHIHNIGIALRNWWRILKVGGYLILLLPHRDYYERKTELPSENNADHKHYFLPFKSEPPCTVSVFDLIKAVCGCANIIQINVCCDLMLKERSIDVWGEEYKEEREIYDAFPEYSIECIIQKTGVFECKN